MLRYYHLTKKLLGIFSKNQDDNKIMKEDAKVIFHKIYNDIRVNIYESNLDKPPILSHNMIDEFEYFSMNFYLIEKHYYDVEEMIAKGQVIHSYSPRDEESIQESFEEVITYLYLYNKRVNNQDLTHMLSINFYKILNSLDSLTGSSDLL